MLGAWGCLISGGRDYFTILPRTIAYYHLLCHAMHYAPPCYATLCREEHIWFNLARHTIDERKPILGLPYHGKHRRHLSSDKVRQVLEPQ